MNVNPVSISTPSPRQASQGGADGDDEQRRSHEVCDRTGFVLVQYAVLHLTASHAGAQRVVSLSIFRLRSCMRELLEFLHCGSTYPTITSN